MNRLQFETSPYLLQHSENPVDWYPWGSEAFEKAKREDRPVLLSIGYSACHWCHVMEKESFTNEAIASIMNENFVNIKVDREEHPEVDSIYMNFVQLTTGSGGWPLTVFLTPDLIPFYGGTYFPPDDRYGRPGFGHVLHSIADTFKHKRKEIAGQAEEVIEALRRSQLLNSKKEGSLELNDFRKLIVSIEKNYDKDWGGFGNAPKFPQAMTHQLLMRFYRLTGDKGAMEMAEHSLKKMASGGIYDQIGGGFHRYSTDRKWLVPHFEKMLYDNALLSRTYLEAYQVTKNRFYLETAEDILSYVLREMVSPEGAFYSSQDADSEGEEGKFFVWDAGEWREILTNEEFKQAYNYYGLSEGGNFEGRNILTRNESGDAAGESQMLATVREKIRILREKRIHPALDDKILTNWNSLMIYSFALAYGITEKQEYAGAAEKAAEFLLGKCRLNGILLHSYKQGESGIEGFLDDYAFLAEALFMLFEVTSDEKWLEASDQLAGEMTRRFYDEENHGFYFTEKNAEKLIVRVKDLYDNALPSGNSSAVMILLKLSEILNKNEYLKPALKSMESMKEYMIRYPESFAYLCSAALFYLSGPSEIVIAAENESAAEKAKTEYFNEFFPFSVLALKAGRGDSNLEILHGKGLIKPPLTVYICRNFSCSAPVFSIAGISADYHQMAIT